MKNPRPSSRCFGVEEVGRGHAKTDQHLNREPGNFVVAIAEVFSFRENWHQDDRADPLVCQYQLTLNAVFRENPNLAACAVHCRHCQIRFLAHPRCAGRRDLRCPFGCRRHHHRQRANERSRKHYQTDAGRENKKLLNRKRSQGVIVLPCNDFPQPTPIGQAIGSDSPRVSSSEVELVSDSVSHEVLQLAAPSENVASGWEGGVVDEATLVNSSILPYVQMVATLIEGRTISRDELIDVLRKRMRQRSMGRRARREYVLRYLNQHPP